MLVVATEGVPAVYEGHGSWSKCVLCIRRLFRSGISGDELAAMKEIFERDRYATLAGAKASLPDLESLGYQRVDK
ncbi:hypothetical protein [Paracidobacterium acidisoli]|uniref:Uncharacterized protein n=1 Tax=Paracidobacterium acidisoli TaxID=2303751 RepID=A0A372ISQ1_9BACT|nr:hypothetical protein [Paracidobacterium acidisoli]MBT9330855.1 hypothetical protein [Paracidobacterium acidisoli]